MLINMARILIFGALIIALGFAINWLMNNGGDVPIELMGQEYRPSLLGLIIALVVLLLVFYIFVKLVELGLAIIAFIMGDQKAINRYFGRRRHRKGLDALDQSVIAMASGDSKTALAKAYKADKNLDKPALTGIMVAEAAKAQGKRKEAEEAYKKVLSQDHGRFAAIRGLMGERLASGDQDKAMKLAEKAYALRPNDSETVNTLFELQVNAGEYNSARETLKAVMKADKIPANIIKRREAVLAISEAQTIDRETDPDQYKDRVELAHRLAPNLVPAAVLASQAKAQSGNMRAADTIIVKAWNAKPHPDLSTAYGRLVDDPDPQARLRRFKVLTKRQKNDPETKLLLAELLIGTEDFPAARRAMGELGENPSSSRAYMIMAAIEHGEGADDSIVRAFLAQAARASRGAQWTCNDCGHVHNAWQVRCDNCNQFDSLDWIVPPENPDADAGLTAVLPMISAKPAGSEIVEVVSDAEIVEDNTSGDHGHASANAGGNSTQAKSSPEPEIVR